MSREEQLVDVLQRFSKYGLEGIRSTRKQPMNNEPIVGKQTMASCTARKSPRTTKKVAEQTKVREYTIIIPIFPSYMIPRKSLEPIVLPPVSESRLYVPEVPHEVTKVKNLLGRTDELKYADHDLTDTKKFPRFHLDQYLKVLKDDQGEESIIPLDWADNLHRATILNLVGIPHFGQSPEVNVVVKLLLTRVHGGYLWMKYRISKTPTTFMDKTKDKKLAE